MTDLLICAHHENKIVCRGDAVFLHMLKDAHQGTGTDFVIQKAGFDKAAFRNLNLWVDCHKITVADAECFHIRFCFHNLVNADFHLIDLTFSGRRVFIYMRCGRTGKYPAISCMNAAVFPIQCGNDRAADVGDCQHTVAFDGAYHQPKCVAVRTEADCFFTAGALYINQKVSLIVALSLITQGCCLVGYKVNCLFCITGWGVRPQKS